MGEDPGRMVKSIVSSVSIMHISKPYSYLRRGADSPAITFLMSLGAWGGTNFSGFRQGLRTPSTSRLEGDPLQNGWRFFLLVGV